MLQRVNDVIRSFCSAKVTKSSGLTGPVLWIGQVIAGSAWTIYHILIVLLQAFIFMMLALVYIGQAHESH